MTVLRLGVMDFPYIEGGKTTGDVAEILEAKYGIMEFFDELHGQENIDDLTEGLKGFLENARLGATGNYPHAEAEAKIQQRFREFLDKQEMDFRVDGVPTRAALKGVNHRLKRPYRKANPPRPSFIDTGIYQASMMAVIEED